MKYYGVVLRTILLMVLAFLIVGCNISRSMNDHQKGGHSITFFHPTMGETQVYYENAEMRRVEAALDAFYEWRGAIPEEGARLLHAALIASGANYFEVSFPDEIDIKFSSATPYKHGDWQWKRIIHK